MGALYLRDLADKTRRGLEGRVLQGRCTGTVPYGYRTVRRPGPDGEPERGLREPDPAEAAVVRRIFRDYAAGASPRAIARALNAEGVPGPGGGLWRDDAIRGRPGRGCGILRAEAYTGRLVWSRARTVKDPLTGGRRRRANDPARHVVRDAPALRIVDDALWDAARARLARDAAPRPGGEGEPRFWETRRPRHLDTSKNPSVG